MWQSWYEMWRRRRVCWTGRGLLLHLVLQADGDLLERGGVGHEARVLALALALFHGLLDPLLLLGHELLLLGLREVSK